MSGLSRSCRVVVAPGEPDLLGFCLRRFSIAALHERSSSFAQIRVLEGRWRGVGPDGKAFFDEYLLSEPTVFRSIRDADGAFNEVTDGGTVTLRDGFITSTWCEFTWKATTLTVSKACFEPVNAPSSFRWEHEEADTGTVTQRWTDSDGKEQSFLITLNRV